MNWFEAKDKSNANTQENMKILRKQRLNNWKVEKKNIEKIRMVWEGIFFSFSLAHFYLTFTLKKKKEKKGINEGRREVEYK